MMSFKCTREGLLDMSGKVRIISIGRLIQTSKYGAAQFYSCTNRVAESR